MARIQSTKGGRIREFFNIEAEVLRRRFRVLQTLLPSSTGSGAAHKGEEGRHVEALLRDFLNRHLPSELRAMSGFIVKPATKTGSDNLTRVETETDNHSTQLDVIIYDIAHYPVYEQFEEFCVVPPEGVIGVISVKKTLRRPEVKKEVQALARVADLCHLPNQRGPYIGLFAFQAADTAMKADDIFKTIEPTLKHHSYDSMVNEIIVIDRYVIFKWRLRDSPDGTVRYVNVNCKNKMYIAIQRMIQSILGVYYDASRVQLHERPGFVSFKKGTFGRAPVLGDLPYPNKPPK
jgi:hypothetical protein